jgi:cell division protein FtsL
MLDNQTIKKDKKYKFTPLEKRFIKIYLLLAVFYSIVSVYLLSLVCRGFAFEFIFNLPNTVF